jgi:hypothetical protein
MVTKRTVIELLEIALRGDLRDEELSRRWPVTTGEATYGAIREDLAFALAHLPVGDDLTTVNLRQWKQMPEYHDLELHIAALRSDNRLSEPSENDTSRGSLWRRLWSRI